MRIDFQLGRPRRRCPDRRRHVGRRRQLGHGRARRADRRRGDRRHPPALRSWRGGAARAPAAPARTSTTPSRSRTGSGIAHYVLDYESRFREGVIDRFVDEYAHGRTPVPCAVVQPGREVRRSRRVRARTRRRLPRDRPLCAAGGERRPASSCTRAPIRGATRAIFFTARRASSWISCASRSATCRRTKCGGLRPRSASRSRPSPTARTSASCPTAIMPRW